MQSFQQKFGKRSIFWVTILQLLHFLLKLSICHTDLFLSKKRLQKLLLIGISSNFCNLFLHRNSWCNRNTFLRDPRSLHMLCVSWWLELRSRSMLWYICQSYGIRLSYILYLVRLSWLNITIRFNQLIDHIGIRFNIFRVLYEM